MSKGYLFLLIGPSGAGKTTVKNAILANVPSLKHIPSITTRRIREGEVDGVDYYFVNKEIFDLKRETCTLLEWEEHFGYFYGIDKELYTEALNSGISLIKEMSWGGVMQLKSSEIANSICSIFILPDDLMVIKTRLIERKGSDTSERVGSLDDSLSQRQFCDYTVTSHTNNIAKTVAEIEAIIVSVITESKL